MPLYLEHGQPVVTSVVHSFHVQECKLVALVDEGICNGICFGRELCPVVACKRRQAWDVIVSTTHWWQSGRCRGGEEQPEALALEASASLGSALCTSRCSSKCVRFSCSQEDRGLCALWAGVGAANHEEMQLS